MLSLKNQYLREMGVDVWLLRSQLPALSSALSSAPSPAGGDTLRTPDSVHRHQRGQAEIQSPRPPAKALGKALGPAPGPAPGSRRQPKVSKTPAPIPEFHLCFATYSNGLSLVFSVPLSASALPDQYRRFTDDVALAFANPGQIDSQVTSLRWPMVQASHIEQSETEARLIVAQRIEKCADKLVLFGQAPARFVPDSGTSINAEEIESYFNEPLRKRDLWRALRALRSHRE